MGRRAADSAKMPPPHPMSRYRSFAGVDVDKGTESRHRDMKVWRSGFMRCRRRDGPWGSHQLEASALKWDTSVGSTEDLGVSWLEEVVERRMPGTVVSSSIRRGASCGRLCCVTRGVCRDLSDLLSALEVFIAATWVVSRRLKVTDAMPCGAVRH